MCVCIVSICVYVWVWVCAHVWGVCVYGSRLDTVSQIIIASLKQEWTCKNLLNEPLKKCFSGWRDGSVIKDAFNYWTWQPEFNPSRIHMVKRESQLLESGLWTSMHVPRHAYPRHLWISKSNKIFKKMFHETSSQRNKILTWGPKMWLGIFHQFHSNSEALQRWEIISLLCRVTESHGTHIQQMITEMETANQCTHWQI